ncbi:MAG: 3-oxoacyl-ACP reductase FabG [Xanthomonadales bacterium]|nr:3-oxoacyl-ACP reductase FabG [Gammaproteobacteria bacterium]MBT8052725.1 3-oxoacyl-ACP reductase FabG [Gammaproteobacteria bacterium]NND55919.1 3-oxoacyl-ACP reductase FabG [Xanthomonadales bacterium]NNK50617.1 3-oxoacyl-ACP reductase FabG [Xanthomonadales bacterium]
MKLEGQVAIVTGASRGIGAAIADSLAAAGAQVAGTATTSEGAAAIKSRLEAISEGHAGEVLDVNDPEGAAGLVSRVGGALGTPTILVNNAGITRDQILMRMKDEEWDDVIETNLRSVFRLSKACLRGMMKARTGRIISIASVVGSMGNAGQTNYAAAKAGMMGFTRSLAREIGSRNITVNVVAPGFIDTDMTRALDENQKAALLKDIPLQRLGEPDDIAASVLFLASAQGGYITGQTLHVNGGMYMI